MKSFETIGTKLLYDDNGWTCRSAETIMKIEFVGKEIVRCKDCKHRNGDYCHNDEGFAHAGNIFFVRPDDFCSRGERKDEARE